MSPNLHHTKDAQHSRHEHHLIGLPGWRAIQRKENDHDMVLVAEFDDSAIEVCPKCGEVTPKLHKHDSLQQEFVDTPMHGKRVRIQLRRQRWRHADCGGTFLQPITGIDDKRAMTTRLVDHIERLSLRRRFTRVAGDVGVSEKTVRNIFAGYVERLEAATAATIERYIESDCGQAKHIKRPKFGETELTARDSIVPS